MEPKSAIGREYDRKSLVLLEYSLALIDQHFVPNGRPERDIRFSIVVKVRHLAVDVGVFPILAACLPGLIFEDALSFVAKQRGGLVVAEQQQFQAAAVDKIGGHRFM